LNAAPTPESKVETLNQNKNVVINLGVTMYEQDQKLAQKLGLSNIEITEIKENDSNTEEKEAIELRDEGNSIESKPDMIKRTSTFANSSFDTAVDPPQNMDTNSQIAEEEYKPKKNYWTENDPSMRRT
jgi:hypothetical protein